MHKFSANYCGREIICSAVRIVEKTEGFIIYNRFRVDFIVQYASEECSVVV